MIYVVTYRTSLTEYLFTDSDSIIPIFLQTAVKKSIISRVLDKLHYKVWDRFYSCDFLSDIQFRLSSLTSNDKLIFLLDIPYDIMRINMLCKHVADKVVYLWNPKSYYEKNVPISRSLIKNKDKYLCIIDYCNRLGIRVATFDESDANHYKIGYYPQFYRKRYNVCSDVIPNSFFFLGRDKGRKKVLDSMMNIFSKYGKCNFIITDTNTNKDTVKYDDYIKKLIVSGVLCDVVQSGQTGMTLRILEGLFYRKKIITNNVHISKYPFFNSTNFLIYKEDISDEEITEFLNSNYIDYPTSIIENYSMEKWAKSV